MAAVCYQAFCSPTSFCNADKQKVSIKVNVIPGAVKMNGVFTTSSVMCKIGSHLVFAASATEVASVIETKSRQNIPTKKQLVDHFRQGIITEGGVGYRQTIVIRSYEVGADKTAKLESIINLLQETALNHVWVSGLLGDGFGATHEVVRNSLIWVMTRMQVQVDDYPIWGEVVEVDTWVGPSGKNGMRRDWQIRSHATGQVFARATSTWVMMNQKTRRLSKMPEEVRAQISPWFIEKKTIQEEIPDKIDKLDVTAKYVNSNLKAIPKRSDLDMNHHVNNVKYVSWMLETIPSKFLENFQLSCITVEYRRECGSSDVVQSLCEPEDVGINRDSLLSSDLFQDYSASKFLQRYTHLLQTTGKNASEEIVRGRTTWKRKLQKECLALDESRSNRRRI